jgi:integrase
MIGTIDTSARCPKCGGRFQYDENRSGLFCPLHPDVRSSGPFRVRFGRELDRRFGFDFKSAETFLLGLRHEVTLNKFDPRDYKSSAPLGFTNQAKKWLQLKKNQVKPRVHKGLVLVMKRASAAWGQKNVKEISEGDIEDFLYELNVGNKTMSNHKSVLHDFWKWLSRREGIRMPAFPEINFKMGWRDIIDITTQQAIIDELKRISYDKDPKVWLAVRMLSRYFHIRPGELLSVLEGQIKLEIPAIVIPPASTKIGEPVIVFLWEDDAEQIAALPRGLPGLKFFRHPAGRRAEAGKPYGQRFLYKQWTQACKNLGLMQSETRPIVDLYAGTRHSTITAMGEFMSPEEVQQASGHRTTQALMRYLQGRARYAQKAGTLVQQIQGRARGEVIAMRNDIK